MPSHEPTPLLTFVKHEDTALPTDHPMTAPSTYATLSPAVLGGRADRGLARDQVLMAARQRVRTPAALAVLSEAGAAGARCALRAP